MNARKKFPKLEASLDASDYYWRLDNSRRPYPSFPFPQSTIDIRTLPDIADVTLEVNILNIVDQLPLPESIKIAVKELVLPHQDRLYHVVSTETANISLRQGRGVYTIHGTVNEPYVIYTKGSGKIGFEDDSLAMFRFGDEWFYDWGRENRIYGAAYIDSIRKEFVNSLYIFIHNVHATGAQTRDDILNLGLSFPLGVVRFDGASRTLRKTIKQLPPKFKRNNIEIGSVSMIVPTYTRAEVGLELRAVEFVADTLMRLWIHSGATIIPNSAHLQNFYRKPYHCYEDEKRKHAVDNAFDRRIPFTAQGDNEDLLIRSSVSNFEGYWPYVLAVSLKTLYGDTNGSFHPVLVPEQADKVFNKMKRDLGLSDTSNFLDIGITLYERSSPYLIGYDDLLKVVGYTPQQVDNTGYMKSLDLFLEMAREEGYL